MAVTILSAQVTNVPIGLRQVEGLLLDNDEFAIAIQQAATLFSVPQNNAQRDFKSLLGERFQFLKIKAERAERQNRAENALHLNDFERLLRKLDRQGNKLAQDFVDELVGLSLVQLFSDAFGREFGEQHRQKWLTLRQATKQSFWWFTDEIKKYIELNPSPNSSKHYVAAFKAMSVGLFAKEPNVIKSELGIKDADLNRDHFGNEALRRIDVVQEFGKVNLWEGSKPTASIQKAIQKLGYTTMDYRS